MNPYLCVIILTLYVMSPTLYAMSSTLSPCIDFVFKKEIHVRKGQNLFFQRNKFTQQNKLREHPAADDM